MLKKKTKIQIHLLHNFSMTAIKCIWAPNIEKKPHISTSYALYGLFDNFIRILTHYYIKN